MSEISERPRNPDTGVAVAHVVVFFDAVLDGADGNGWCVELWPDSTSYRFPTLTDAAVWLGGLGKSLG